MELRERESFRACRLLGLSPPRERYLHIRPSAADGAFRTDGRRGGPLGNPSAELYYDGELILVSMRALEICLDE